MPITPDDLRAVRFAPARKGYDTAAVDKTIDTAARSLQALLQEREQLQERVTALEAEVAEAREQLRRSATTAPPAPGAGSSTSRAQELAMAELLAETRLIRGLLQSALEPRPAPPPRRPAP